MKTLRVEKGNVIMIPAAKTGDTYVVEEAGLGGGGTGHGPHDVYPDAWQVQARQLTEDGTYDAEGRVIRFVQAGLPGSTSYTDTFTVAVLGSMTQSFV